MPRRSKETPEYEEGNLMPRWPYDCGHCKMHWNCGPTSQCFSRLVKIENESTAYPKNRTWCELHIFDDVSGERRLRLKVQAEVTPAIFGFNTLVHYRVPVSDQRDGKELQMSEWQPVYVVEQGKYKRSYICVSAQQGAMMELAK